MRKFTCLLAAVSLAGIACVYGQSFYGKADRWLVAGAFTSAQTNNLLETPFFDEAAAAPANGDKAGTLNWKAIEASFVDFTKQGFSKSGNCAGYAFTYIYAPSPRLATLLFGSDDGSIIWLNGIRVLERPVQRSFVENQDTAHIQLGQGWNRLLIKVDQGGGGWEMACTVSGRDIRVSSERPAAGEMAVTADPAVARIGIRLEGNDKVILRAELTSRKGSAGITSCELNGGGKPVPATIRANPSGATAEFTMPLKSACTLLAGKGVTVRVTGSGGTNQVPVEGETAADLLTLVASTPAIAGAEMVKTAASIEAMRKLYGIQPDISNEARAALGHVAAGRMAEAKVILDGIASSVTAGIPDLRGDSIYITGHAHMDMNWLWPYDESVKMFQDNFRQMAAFMERFPDYRFLQSQATIYRHIELIDPPLFEKVKKYVSEGRLELAGGMWTESDANLTGGEALCRTLLLGQRYFLDRFGKMARVGWLPDNFGHISQFPQMLKLSGMDFYYFHRCVPFIGPFRWIGPDSSNVLCFTNYTYNGEIAPSLRKEVDKISPVTRKILHPTGIGDHGGGPTLKNIGMIHQLDSAPGFPSIKFASVEEFFKKTEKMPVKLPVHRGEMQFIFEGCYTSVAEIKENTRKSEQAMYRAEFLSASRWLSGEKYPAGELKDLWETVAFNQFHDILPGSAIYESYQDAVADHKMVQKKAAFLFESDFRRLADEIKFKTDLGQPVVVLNMQPRSGKVLVEAEVYTHEKPATATLSAWGDYYEYNHLKPTTGHQTATVLVRDGSGRSWPAQITGGKVFPPGYRSTVEFVIDSMPAGGYRTFYVDAMVPGAAVAPIPEKDGVFDTDLFIATVDMKSGDITGLKDKRTGRQYVAPGGSLNRLKIWMEAPNGMNAWTIGETKEIRDITNIVSVNITEKGPVRATIEVVKQWGRSKFIQRTHIYKNYPRIDFELEVHWFETGDGVNPAPFLRTTFDLAMENPVFNSHVPFDVVSRPVNGQEVPAQQWVDVSDAKGGIALLNTTRFGHSFEQGQLRLSLLRATYSPNRYPNIGVNHIRYSLFPHAGDWKNGVWAEAERFNVPVYAAEPPSLALVKTHATRPETGSLLSVFPQEVVMSGIKQGEDGKSLIIRLAEVNGKETLATVTLPVTPAGASRVSIIELPLNGVSKPVVEGNTVKVVLKPHEIVTVSIRVTRE
jgi:alpha-mannosidase